MSDLACFPFQTRDDAAPAPLVGCASYVALRRGGARIAAEWVEGGAWIALERLLAAHPGADLAEICVGETARRIEPAAWAEALGAAASGHVGLEVRVHGRVFRLAPTEAIAANLPLRWFLQRVLDQVGLDPERFAAVGGVVAVLEMGQFLLFLDVRKPGGEGEDDEAGAEATPIDRGARIAPPEPADDAAIDRIVAAMTAWLRGNLGVAGQLPYRYRPNQTEDIAVDNPIRRFAASIALQRLARATDDAALADAAWRNLRFNLMRFYREDGDLGMIVQDGSVKLGALAMAATAILESPRRPMFEEYFRRLLASIDHLWREGGAFRSFLLPEDRDDNQDFYPGQAILLWAEMLERRPNERLMARATESLLHYRARFQAAPELAFTPWHSMACAILSRLTGRAELRDHLFAMNDWLLAAQQWGGDLEPDFWGRFHAPGARNDPPHASTTGVCLEGLTAALAVARAEGDATRASRYERAIRRGARSIARLQFQDAADLFYVEAKSRAYGGVRSEVYDNTIRVDNVHHALMALLRFREILARPAQA